MALELLTGSKSSWLDCCWDGGCYKSKDLFLVLFSMCTLLLFILSILAWGRFFETTFCISLECLVLAIC